MKVLGFHVISETPISLQGVWIVMLDNHFNNICHLPEHLKTCELQKLFSIFLKAACLGMFCSV